jgi:hypothetical protein
MVREISRSSRFIRLRIMVNKSYRRPRKPDGSVNGRIKKKLFGKLARCRLIASLESDRHGFDG